MDKDARGILLAGLLGGLLGFCIWAALQIASGRTCCPPGRVGWPFKYSCLCALPAPEK